MDVLVLFLAFLDDLLGGLHLALHKPIGLWEPEEGRGLKWYVGCPICGQSPGTVSATYCGPLSLTV